MNQNLLKYFQARQSQGQSQDHMQDFASLPKVMQNMPMEPAERVSAPSPAPYNPFDEGIKRAIEASRFSLSPTPEQQSRAMRGGMLEFGSALKNMPKERGFLANLGQAGQALAPAIHSIDASNSSAEAENLALANQILAYQNAEREKARREEENAWHREYKERELEERRQNHLLHNFMRKATLEKGKMIDPDYVQIEGMPFRKLDKIGMRHALSDRREAAKANHEIQELYKSWNKLEDKTKNNIFAPIGGWSGLTNMAKDFAGRYLGSESLREETAIRQDLEAKLGQLTTALERTKTGKGLTQGMFDRLKDYYPNKNDNAETLKLKLKSASEDAELFSEAANLTAQYGADITIDDVKRLREMHENQESSDPTAPEAQKSQSNSSMQGSVMMIGPDGDNYNIPIFELEDARNNGFKMQDE